MQRFNRSLPIVLYPSAERVTIIRFFKKNRLGGRQLYSVEVKEDDNLEV